MAARIAGCGSRPSAFSSAMQGLRPAKVHEKPHQAITSFQRVSLVFRPSLLLRGGLPPVPGRIRAREAAADRNPTDCTPNHNMDLGQVNLEGNQQGRLVVWWWWSFTLPVA